MNDVKRYSYSYPSLDSQENALIKKTWASWEDLRQIFKYSEEILKPTRSESTLLNHLRTMGQYANCFEAAEDPSLLQRFKVWIWKAFVPRSFQNNLLNFNASTMDLARHIIYLEERLKLLEENQATQVLHEQATKN